jgi:hypothetical protein
MVTYSVWENHLNMMKQKLGPSRPVSVFFAIWKHEKKRGPWSKVREAGVDANVISEAEEILKAEAVSAAEPGLAVGSNVLRSL